MESRTPPESTADPAAPLAQPGAASRRPVRDPIDMILTAAGELLDEQGYEGLSTTAVATRAGVSTATLYRLFPDKFAILRALVQRLHSQRASTIRALYESVATADDWREPLAQATRHTYEERLAQPGGRATRRALQLSPELWSWEQQHQEDLASELARALMRRKRSIGRATAHRIALSTVTATAALLDTACIDPRRGKILIEEAIDMRAAYLARYLD